MKTSMKTKLIPLLALALAASALFFAGAGTAYAAEALADSQTLSVDKVWLTGDMLNIAVTDSISGESQTLELALSDYAQPGDEYVTIQATDSNGRLSNPFHFRNPYYAPNDGIAQPNDGKYIPDKDGEPMSDEIIDMLAGVGYVPDKDGEPVSDKSIATLPDGGCVPDWDGEPVPGEGSDALPESTNPFTPDGTGTVIDNAKESDGKEFFNVKTPDGNVFYLIIDRQRSQENVYFLNAVTEQDLLALAKPGDGNVSIIPAAPTVQPEPEPEPQVTEEPATPTPPAEKSGGNGSLVLIIIAVVAVGGAGYYFKIVRPKRNGGIDDDDYDDEPEDNYDDMEVDMENNDEEENDL